jgi:hypothetical protein
MSDGELLVGDVMAFLIAAKWAMSGSDVMKVVPPAGLAPAHSDFSKDISPAGRGAGTPAVAPTFSQQWW